MSKIYFYIFNGPYQQISYLHPFVQQFSLFNSNKTIGIDKDGISSNFIITVLLKDKEFWISLTHKNKF